MNINSINASMNFGKNPRIRVSKRKIEKTEMAVDKAISSVLPKEMPLEKKVYFVSQEEAFDRVKNAIQISIDNMRNK